VVAPPVLPVLLPRPVQPLPHAAGLSTRAAQILHLPGQLQGCCLGRQHSFQSAWSQAVHTSSSGVRQGQQQAWHPIKTWKWQQRLKLTHCFTLLPGPVQPLPQAAGRRIKQKRVVQKRGAPVPTAGLAPHQDLAWQQRLKLTQYFRLRGAPVPPAGLARHQVLVLQQRVKPTAMLHAAPQACAALASSSGPGRGCAEAGRVSANNRPGTPIRPGQCSSG
jgi:hypothetical protein